MDADDVRVAAEAGHAEPVVDVRGDQRGDRGAVAVLVVAVEVLERSFAADRPDAVDLAGEVGHVRDAGVDDADDDVRVALRDVERTVDVRRGNDHSYGSCVVPSTVERYGSFGRLCVCRLL